MGTNYIQSVVLVSLYEIQVRYRDDWRTNIKCQHARWSILYTELCIS